MYRHATPVVLALVLGSASGASAQHFVDERIPTVPDPGTASGTKLARGDVDGDGWSELVVRNFGSSDVLLRGGPEGFTFSSIVSCTESVDPVLVDLNGDSRDDLLTVNTFMVGYYLGHANATLGSFVNIQAKGTNESFWTKRAADVNGDGKIDVIVAVATDVFGSTGVLRWFAGNGAGAFGSPQSTPSTPYPLVFQLGDFNADGFVDAAAAGPSGNGAFVFAGTGTGFAAPIPLAPISAALGRHLATGDFDADGIDDLVCFASPTVSWFRGGVGGLTVAGTFSMPGATGAARDLVAADLEQDGDDDLLLVEGISTGRVWSSHGAPGAGLSAPTSLFPTLCSSVAAIETNGDPGLDLAYTATPMVYPTLRPSNGAGGFLAPQEFAVAGACPDEDTLCAGDIDRDGALDLAFESGFWLRGAGDGTFAAAAPLGANPSRLVDLNDDGRLDAVNLLTACGGANGINVALSTGSGFGPTIRPPQPPAGTLVAITIGDLDGDGDLDLASAGASGAVSHLNNGAGAFPSFVNSTLPLPPPSQFSGSVSATRIGAGDLNGDGRDDIAMAVVEIDVFQPSVHQALLEWGLSTGNGQVTAHSSFGPLFNSSVGDLAIEDANGNAIADIVYSQSAIYALNGNGAGGMSPMGLLSQQPGSSALSIAFADIDGDGLRDVIGGGPAANQVTISRGTGSGYAVWRQIAAGAGAGRLLPFDFNADGRVDLAFGFGNNARLARNVKSTPPGTSVFGTGTFGCLGRVSIGSAQVPEVGNSAFRLLVNHLPPNGYGWIILGSASSLAGIPAGVLLHVNPAPPAVFILVPSTADSSGQTSLPLPIPNDSLLFGLTFTAQAIHTDVLSPGAHCSLSGLDLVSSRGLTMTIQP